MPTWIAIFVASVDQLANTMGKVAKSVASAIGGGYEIMEWKEARDTRKKLLAISGKALELNQTYCARLVSTVEDFILHPKEPNTWKRSIVSATLADIDKLLSQLKLAEDQVVTTEFYADLSLTLRTLSKY